MNGTFDENIIASNFADYFGKIYSCNNITQAEKLKSDYDVTRKDYRGFSLTEAYTFDVEQVSAVISKLSLGEAAARSRPIDRGTFYTLPRSSIMYLM